MLEYITNVLQYVLHLFFTYWSNDKYLVKFLNEKKIKFVSF